MGGGDAVSPSTVLHAEKHAAALFKKEPEVRRRAAEALQALVTGPRTAAVVAKHVKALSKKLSDTDSAVIGAALGALRAVAEEGEGRQVGIHAACDVAQCLKCEDVSLRRRAAVVCRSVAEGGGAALMQSHVPALAAIIDVGPSLVAPVEALGAMAAEGEARAVALHAAGALGRSLTHVNPAIRIAACDVAATLGEGGCAEEVRSARSRAGEAADDSMLGVAVVLVATDGDRDVRLAAARALSRLAACDIGSAAALRGRHCDRLLAVMCGYVGRGDSELRNALKRTLGIDKDDEDSEEECAFGSEVDGDSSDAEASGRPTCVVCQRDLRRHGTVQELSCTHVFHERCIRRWFRWSKKATCPLCRRLHDSSSAPDCAVSDGAHLRRIGAIRNDDEGR